MARKRQKSKETEPLLTEQQRLFCLFYAASLNAAHAARKAGYSPDSARFIGHENLTKPYIRAEIDRLLAEIRMPPREIIERLAQMARGEHAEFINVKQRGKVATASIDLEGLKDAGLMHLIKEIECDELTGNVTKVKFHDALAALVHLGKAAAIFTEKTEVSGPNGGPQEIIIREENADHP